LGSVRALGGSSLSSNYRESKSIKTTAELAVSCFENGGGPSAFGSMAFIQMINHFPNSAVQDAPAVRQPLRPRLSRSGTHDA